MMFFNPVTVSCSFLTFFSPCLHSRAYCELVDWCTLHLLLFNSNMSKNCVWEFTYRSISYKNAQQ